jgi:hypothetical protein
MLGMANTWISKRPRGVTSSKTALKYFIIGLVVDVIIVSLTLVLSPGHDGTCHTLLGGSLAGSSLSRYVQNDVMFGVAVVAPYMLPLLLIIPLCVVVLAFIKKAHELTILLTNRAHGLERTLGA